MNKKNIGSENPFYGKKHSDETRKKLSKPRKYNDDIINEVIRLKEIKKFTYQQISDIMNMKSKNISNIYYRYKNRIER